MLSFIGNHGVPSSKEARTSFPGGARIEMLPESTRFGARRIIDSVGIKHRLSAIGIRVRETTGSGGIRPYFFTNGSDLLQRDENSLQLKLFPHTVFFAAGDAFSTDWPRSEGIPSNANRDAGIGGQMLSLIFRHPMSPRAVSDSFSRSPETPTLPNQAKVTPSRERPSGKGQKGIIGDDPRSYAPGGKILQRKELPEHLPESLPDEGPKFNDRVLPPKEIAAKEGPFNED